jgi:recombination protein RecA
VEFDIMYGEGISREGDILDLAVETQIVEKSGAWFSFDGERIGQGRENSKVFLKEHAEIKRKIEHKILDRYGIAKKPKEKEKEEKK